MERSTIGIKLCLRVAFLLATSAALVAAAAPPAALEAPPALRLCIETLGIHGGYVPVQMAAVMLLAVDHVKEGNCTLLPGGECPPGMGPLPGLVVTLYDTKLKPALGLESARKCKTEAEGHIYVLSLTQDVHVVSPVNSMNDLVTASASATEDVLGDDLFHPHLIRVRPGSSQMARKIIEFIHSIGWKQVAILYAKDATGMSYGPEITGFAADLGIATTSVVLNGANPNATYSSLADLRAQGIKVILSLFTPKEMFKIFPVAKELGLFEPEYTWLGAGDGIANPKAMVGRSPDPEQMAEMLNGVLVFTTAAKATPGTAALGQHAKQRGVDELYTLFDPNITDTVTRGMELPFTSTLLFHSYELIWLLAKGHTASAQSPAGAEDASYADRFVSAVTAENFSVEGLTGLIKLDQRRGRQVQDGDFEFHVHQISNTSSLQLLGMVENASFALDDSVSSFMWRDGSYFPEDVPSDGSKESEAADGRDKYHQNVALIVGLAVVGAILAIAVVCLFVLFRRVKGRLRWMEDNSGDSAYRLNLHSPAAEAADILTILSDSYLLSAKLRKRAWGAARDLLSSNDPHAPMIQDISQDGGGISSDHQFAADRQKLRDMARHFLTQTTNNTTDTTRMLGEFIQASHGKLLLSSGTKSDSRRDSGAPTDEEVGGLCTLLANAERTHPELLAQLGVRMSINIFDIYETCEEQPLVLSAMTIIRRFDLIRTLRLNEHKLILYLKKVEMGYDSTNPYHNNIHAADVLNRLACILSAEGLFFDGSHASGCILLSAIIAAAVHDYGHPGMNNDCEVAFDTPASRQFNEVAVLEMQSAFETLQMLRDDSRLDFMENLPSRIRRSVMSHVIHLVLATDMKRHFAMIGEFKSTITQKVGNKVSTTKQPPMSSPTGQGADRKTGINKLTRITSGAKMAADAPVDAQPASSRNLNSFLGSARSWLEQTTTRGKDEPGQVGVDLQSWSEAEKTLVISLAIKVADIGHSFLPWELHKQWSARLEEEFFSQGQRYVDAGMDPPMLMDPAKPGVTEPVNQIAFYNIIALPLLNTWAEVFRSSGQQLQAHANANVGNWQQAAKRLSSANCSVPVDEEALHPGTKVSSVGRGAADTLRAFVQRRNNNTVAAREQPRPEYELPHVVN